MIAWDGMWLQAGCPCTHRTSRLCNIIYIKHKGEWGHLGGQDEKDEEIGMYIIYIHCICVLNLQEIHKML